MTRETSAAELTLSVIIVNWNVRDELRECLTSLTAGLSLADDDYEIVVVDNASDDGSAEMVRRDFGAVELIENTENVGFARANNQAFTRCRGRRILLLNPDTEVGNGAVARMLEILDEDPRIGAVGARVLNADGSLQRVSAGFAPTTRNVVCHHLFLNRLLPSRFVSEPLYLLREPEAVQEMGWVSGACAMLRARALDDRMFDERFFMYGEDMELCARLRDNGWKVVYAPEASVIHHHGASMSRQSSDEILSAALKGPRAFYVMRRGRKRLLLHDLSIAAGFLLRWGLFRLGSCVLPGKTLERRARGARRQAGIAWRLMRGS